MPEATNESVKVQYSVPGMPTGDRNFGDVGELEVAKREVRLIQH